MTMPRLWTLAGIVVSLSLSPASSRATVVGIEFTGLLDFVEPGLPFSNATHVGDVFRGTYSYDTSAMDTLPDNSSLGAYRFPNSALSVEFGPFGISTAGFGITVYNVHSPLVDRYSVFASSGVSAFDLLWRELGFTLADTTGTAFTSDALPLGPPNLQDFQFERVFLLTQAGARDPSLRGTVTSLATFPEPATFSLVAIGALYTLKRKRPVGIRPPNAH